MFDWIPETQTIVWPLLCGGGIVVVVVFVLSMCKASANADAHIEAIKAELNKEHGKKDEGG